VSDRRHHPELDMITLSHRHDRREQLERNRGSKDHPWPVAIALASVAAVLIGLFIMMALSRLP
jgi:hypothetical protein